MAKKKKQLFEQLRQGVSGSLGGLPKWDAPAGTGSRNQPAPQAQPLTSAPNNSAPLQTLELTQPTQREKDLAEAQALSDSARWGLTHGTAHVTGTPIENPRTMGERHGLVQTDLEELLGDDDVADYIRQRDQAARNLQGLSFGDVLKDPMYAAGTLLENLDYGITDVGRRFVNPDKAEEIDRRVNAYNEATGYKPDAVTATVNRGAANFNASVGDTMNFLVGENLKRLGWKDNPVSGFADALRADQAAAEGNYQRVRQDQSKAGQIAMDVGSSAVEALPDLILLAMSGPAGLAGEGAGALTRGGTRLAGREAAAASMGRLAAAQQTARAVAAGTARNPMFWTSFTRTAGSSYYYAKSQGADDYHASMYALLNATANSVVEIGGGVQKLPGELQKGGSAAWKWFKSNLEEGNEEVVQGFIERGLQNLVYGANNPLFSTTDENAIVNPLTSAQEFGMGFGVSSLLGAPSAVNQGVRNIINGRQTAPQAAEEAPQAEPAPRPAADPATPVESETRTDDGGDPWQRILDRWLSDDNAPVEDTMPETPTGMISQDEADAKARAMMEAIGMPVPSWMQDGTENTAESPVTNDAPQAGNLPGTTQTALTQSETGQNEAQAAQPPQAEAPTRTFAPEDHIDNRTDDYIAKRSTKPFQHEHPELHDNFVVVAKDMQELLYASVESDMPGRKGGTNAWYPDAIRKLLQATGESRPKLIQVLQDIIDNHGVEDYATAKRVEKVLDELLTNGYDAYDPSGRRHVQPDSDYLAKKDAINGAQDRNSLNKYIEENYLRTLEGDTEDDLKNEWEALQIKAQMEQMLGRPLTEADLDSITNPELVEKLRLAQKVEAENAGLQPQTDANGLPEGHGPMSPAFPYREAPTQTHGSDSLYNEDEREIEGLRPEDSTHKVNSDADVDRNVQERLELDYDGEKADLFDNKPSWDDADTATAHRIMEAEIAQARLTGDYSEVIRLQRVWEAHGTMQGQALRQRGRFAHTAADIVGEAATTLDGQDGAQETIDEIAGLADEWEQARAQGNDGTQSMIDLILRLNARRRTGGFFNGRRASRTLQNALNAVAEQDGGLDFLTDIAESQLRNLSADHARLSPMEAIKSVRYLAMLSKLNTTMRNLIGNTAFDITETVSNNVATPLDMLLSLRTGRRTTALDTSWFSEAKRRGAKEAAIRAYIETALDADLGDTSNRFEQRTGRTFKMDSNFAERFLSSMEKWQRYMLTVTDEFAKGGARAEQQRGIDRLTESGALEDGALDNWAEETALQRTFQNDGRISSALQHLRNAGNVLSIRDGRGGSFGLGDAILPFAQVPGNVAGQFFNYSPLGLVKGAHEVFSVLRAGENATAEQQAQAVRDVGRGLNGTAFVALFTAMAANGLLKVAGDDDKDKAALERDEGVSGTQLNLDAVLRWLRGEDTAWQDGDTLMSIGFLEPFNGDMAMGYMLSEAYKDAAADGDVSAGEIAGGIVNANAEASLQAVMDLPAMSTLKNIADAYEYSDADTTAGKMADAGVQFFGDTMASFVPNAVAGIAQGMDEGRTRVTRTSDRPGAEGALENAVNVFKSKIPGLRETLPQALDSWGQGRQTTASPLQNWFNANILPGAITQYDTNEVNQELYRLGETQDVDLPARNPAREVQAGDEKKQLSTDEQRTYQQNAGQTSFRELQELMNTPQYQSMTDAERATAFNAILGYGKAKGEQAVGGSKETPDWAERGDASVAENAGFFGILQAARQQLDKDDRSKAGPQMGAILDRGLSEEDTLGVFRHILTGSSESTMEKIENADDPLAWARNYVGVQEARQTLPEDQQDRNAAQMQAILDSGVSGRQAMEQFKIVLGDSSTVGKVETLYQNGYPLEQIVGYYNASSEKVVWDDEKGTYRARHKDEKIQWLMETYGYTKAQATYVYKVFQG